VKSLNLALNKVTLRFCAAVSVALLSLPVLAVAQDAPTAQPVEPTTMGTISRMGFMFVVVYLVFQYLVIKPQKEKLQQQQDLLKNLKRGDQVVTSGGMIGKVAGVESDHALLELAPNVKVKFEIAHISKKLDKAVAQ
jgi:preprotein translocase subunit YajC